MPRLLDQRFAGSLADTPRSLTGAAGQFVFVAQDENALRFGALPTRRSDVLVTENDATTTYEFTTGGSPMALASALLLVFINRMLLRPGEYTVAGNAVTFLIPLRASDEIEIIAVG